MRALMAEFGKVDNAVAAAREARHWGHPVMDSLTPYPVEELATLVGGAPPRVRVPMAIGGFGMFAAMFAFETWSAVVAYPFNEGGRPLFSWPVFLLAPFEVAVLAAAVVGMAAFLIRCGLPRLNHPLFDSPTIHRASQDRFFLVIDPLDPGRAPALRGLLFGAGALSVSEVEA